MKPLDPRSHIALKSILLATDFSPASEAALPFALTVANHYGSMLYIAHVISPEFMDLIPPDSAATMILAAKRSAQHDMEHLLKAASQRGVSCQALIGDGAIWDVLQDMIQQNDLDLIVLGTHGRRGLRKFLLGSVAEEVFRKAPCPALMVGPQILRIRSMDIHLEHILYPLEFVPDTSNAAAYAISFAEEYHARLTIMKVFEEEVPSTALKAAVQEPVIHWIDDHIPIDSDLRKRTSFEPGFGPAAEGILKFASDRGVDLIVMGARSLDPGMAAHFHQPDTAYEVVRTAPCPVLTVR
jgi:nucleotide-binding universal stress UspA family protein